MSTIIDNEVVVLVDGERFRFWTDISITHPIDGIQTVEIQAPFDAEDKVFRKTFQPLSYKPFNVLVNDESYFVGTMVPAVPRLTPESSVIAAGAYSLPGVLAECTPSPNSLPLEVDKQNLHEIADKYIKPYGINIDAQVEPGPIFKKIKTEPSKKILPFLVELAKQRNQIISNNNVGDLVFWRAVETGLPVAVLEQGLSPLIGVTPTIKSSEYYSSITGIKTIKPRSKSSVSFTVENNLLSNIERPYIFVVPDALDGDLETAVKSKISRMYANAVSYTLAVATWRDGKGDIWQPNTKVKVKAPNAMIYNYYDFIIRSVTLKKSKTEETALLDVMVPGSLGDDKPGKMPWEE